MNNPPPSFEQAQLSAGTRLNGIYEIDRLIARGGMGEVYAGHVIETGDPVAIKVLLPEFGQNVAALTLFRKEASALHHVHDDAVIRYYVFAVEPVLGRPYLAMEFVDGRSLSEILDTDGALTFEAVRSLSQRLASGFQAAHDRGVIHRDISPDNIIVPGGDVARAKIIDFGIARSTQHGTVIGSGFAGKFNYVSPEQLGMFGGDVTARSDIYCLGLVLVHALIGQPIDMGGSQFEIVEKRRSLPNIGAIEMRIRPLLERMLQPDPANRIESMHAVAVWFGGATAPRQGSDLHRPALAAVSSATPPSPRPHVGVYLAILPLVALIAGAGAYYHYGSQVPATPSGPPPKLDNGAGPGATLLTTPSVNPSPGAPAPGTTTPPGTPVPGTKLNPAAPAALSRAETIRHYVDQYDGGDCFYVSVAAVSDAAAALEGFGASTKAFEMLDGDFHRTFGFEADIGVRQVTQQQCPAISFLGKLRTEGTPAPHLDIDKTTVRNGDTLSGLIDRFGDRNIDLVLVSDGGTVQIVSQLLKPGTDAKTFKIGIQRNDGGGGRQPQLLMAITSIAPLATLKGGSAIPATEFFPNLVSQAAQSGQQLSAAARYFLLEK